MSHQRQNWKCFNTWSDIQNTSFKFCCNFFWIINKNQVNFFVISFKIYSTSWILCKIYWTIFVYFIIWNTLKWRALIYHSTAYTWKLTFTWKNPIISFWMRFIKMHSNRDIWSLFGRRRDNRIRNIGCQSDANSSLFSI